MRMQEITDNVIGYNSKTKHMKGVLIPIDYDTDEYGAIIPFNIYWQVEDVHEFIKTYKHDLLEYIDNGFVFLPLKKNKTFDDIDYINDGFHYNDYYGDGELVYLDHYEFDITLSKELYSYVEEEIKSQAENYWEDGGIIG